MDEKERKEKPRGSTFHLPWSHGCPLREGPAGQATLKHKAYKTKAIPTKQIDILHFCRKLSAGSWSPVGIQQKGESEVRGGHDAATGKGGAGGPRIAQTPADLCNPSFHSSYQMVGFCCLPSHYKDRCGEIRGQHCDKATKCAEKVFSSLEKGKNVPAGVHPISVACYIPFSSEPFFKWYPTMCTALTPLLHFHKS